MTAAENSVQHTIPIHFGLSRAYRAIHEGFLSHPFRDATNVMSSLAYISHEDTMLCDLRSTKIVFHVQKDGTVYQIHTQSDTFQTIHFHTSTFDLLLPSTSTLVHSTDIILNFPKLVRTDFA